MASTLNVLLGALVAAAFWTCLGFALARRIVPAPLAWPLAPLLGWAVFNAIALPAFTLVGFATTTVAVVSALALIVSVATLYWTANLSVRPREISPAIVVVAFIGAALLAIAPALAILPKMSGDTVALAPPIFDHSKIAIIDEMARLGLPPGNPFFGEAGEPSRLVYYYLFHFSAAEVALLTGISGWEADAAMTWFAAFASLTLMMGLAAWFAGRPAAAFWVLPLAAAASLRDIFNLLFRSESVYAVLKPATGFGGWLVQTSWAPQHLISGACVVLAILLMSELARRATRLLVVAFALVVVAGFESSTWVGGVTFAAAALAAGLVILTRLEGQQRLPFIVRVAVAAALAAILAAPFVYDQVIATAARGGGAPIALHPYEVLGEFLPVALRRVFDLPAYWLILLPVEFPAIYLVGLVALVSLIASRKLDADRSQATIAFAALAGTSLAVSWLFVSQIGYNDLGWRAAIPGMMVLTIFSAAGLAAWIAARAVVPMAGALILLALGLYEGIGIARENATGTPSAQGRAFAHTPAMWAAVRRHSAPAERIANNPLFMSGMTPWPGNISWALMADRRSCFAGGQLLLAFVPLPSAKRDEIDAQFIRVFAGDGSADDVRELATRYDCRLVVLTAEDKAWTRDPFAASPLYELIDSDPGQWLIYRRKP